MAGAVLVLICELFLERNRKREELGGSCGEGESGGEASSFCTKVKIDPEKVIKMKRSLNEGQI